MSFGDDVIALARAHVGEKYILGARAKFLQPQFKGPWDCAEFVSWVIFQVSNERILLGCLPRDPARADAYTGYWADDAKKYGLIISVNDALKTAGAALLRTPASRRHGHIAFSAGDGKKTVEAYDTAHGVINGSADPLARGWDFGVRIPKPDEWAALTETASKPRNWFFRPTTSPLPDPRVESIETALQARGIKIAGGTGRFTPKLAQAVATFQNQENLVVDGMVGRQTSRALGLDWQSDAAPSGVYNDKYHVFFDSLVPGGFFSHDPDDMSVRRSIRTNNAGALNYSSWQKSLAGYVGVTPPDNSPNRNRTTIYRTPEHGIAAWYTLLADRYGFATSGPFSLETLARKYAGRGASAADVRAYISGWSRASGGTLTANSTFHTQNTDELLSLGRAMFAHETGKKTPLKDEQIRFGIDRQRSGTMPA